MSIKSQKSLLEECSEIVERSYSVRSYSDESLSCEDEDECLARELMNKLTPAAMSKLRRCFVKSKCHEASDIDRRVEEVMRRAAAEEGIEFAAAPAQTKDTLWLDEKGFVAAVEGVFGNHKYTTHASKLFQLLDSFSTGKVRWRQLVCRLVAVGARKTGSRADVWSPIGEMRVEKLEHCKREAIVKLVSIERSDSFCYAAVSRGGRVGVYSGDLQLLHSYEVFYHRTGMQRRLKNCWLTDAVYLPDVQCLILSASDRSLTIYDATTLTHTLAYCVTGLPNIPTCLAYAPYRNGSSELSLGTERGEVIRLRFLQPKVSLLYCKSQEHVNCYFWMELSSPPHTSYVAITTWRRVHSRSIRRLSYSRDGDVLVSCSHDSNVSVRIRHVPGKIGDYTFKVQRGVTCFHIIPGLHLLATGSADGNVRLWETTQSAPFATLTTTAIAAVLDVAVIAAKEIVVAFCSNCWLHIWDLYEECLLQTIKLKFPFLGILGKKVEFGPYCIHPGPPIKPTPQSPQSDPLTPMLDTSVSRRGSSVYQGSTGGLILQADEEVKRHVVLEEDGEYLRYNRPTLLVSCCDFIQTVLIGQQDGDILPPPTDTLRARQPHYWDLPKNLFAGLQGILEKDFVMMQGLKHDLNRKLAEMKDNMDAMYNTVSLGGAYLALNCSENISAPTPDDMMDRYKRVMALFPELSLTGTPTVSNTTTPRKRNSDLLYVPSNCGIYRKTSSNASKDK